MNHLMKLIQINHSFQKSVNLQLDLDDYERIGSYIPTRSSVAIFNRYFEAVLGKSGENATILIGPYGKGKSHLLLVLLGLLHGNQSEMANTVNKIKTLDQKSAQYLETLKKEHKKYLSVLVSQIPGADLNESFIFALREALSHENLSDIAPDNYYSEAIKVIEHWRTEFPDTHHKFAAILEEYSMTEAAFIRMLEKQDKDILQIFMDSYPGLTSGSVFQPLLQMDAVKNYQQVNRILIEEHGYSGMFLVFDEFSKYLEGHGIENFSNDMKTLQDMCELANSSKDAMFLTMVAHKSIHEYGKSIDKSVKNAFRGVEGRIREIPFVVSAQNNYELIADTIIKEEPDFSKEYSKYLKNEDYKELVEASYQLPCFLKLFQLNEFMETLAKGCFPMTPLGAYSLLSISEKVAQNERTIFTFLADEGQGSLPWILEKDKAHLVGIDKIYDYFKNLFRETSDQPQIHMEWMKAEDAISKTSNDLEIQIIKAMALVRMIHREEELPANDVTIRLGIGYPKAEFDAAMEHLKQRNLIVYRTRLGVYDFKANVGIDVEKAIENKMIEISGKQSICDSLSEISELEYELPKRYNQKYAITRYFRYEFLKTEDFLKIKNSEYLFEENFSDGKLIALVREEAEGDKTFDSVSNLVKEHIAKLQDARLVVLLPKEKFTIQSILLKYEAVGCLKSDEKFLEENEVLLQELNLYEEDLVFEINAFLEQNYLPENGQVLIFGENSQLLDCSNSIDLNNYLSDICENYYPYSPKVNHELLNIEEVGAQYRKARNAVVKNILEENDCSGYLSGTNPEAMVYRAAFVHTTEDTGCEKICEEIDKFFTTCAGKKQDFSRLYHCLQGVSYGARRGIIPLFLAKKLADAEGTAVIYLKNRELEVSYETLNNVNEFPDKYELYIEPESVAKDLYLKELEDMFCERGSFALSKQNRVNGIVFCMQKWYRGLPQYAMVTEDFDAEMLPKIKMLRNLLKHAEVNPRELLFDKIPAGLAEESYEKLPPIIQTIKAQLNQKQESLIKEVAKNIKAIFDVEEHASLRACLHEWYQNQSSASKSYILSTGISNLMNYLENLKTNDEQEIVESLSRIVLDVFIDDWNDSSLERFKEELTQMKEEVEGIADSEESSGRKSKFVLQDAEGKEITKYFDADVTDSTSVYLQNMIEEALEDFGDTLEMNQKVAVLVQTIEKLLH